MRPPSTRSMSMALNSTGLPVAGASKKVALVGPSKRPARDHLIAADEQVLDGTFQVRDRRADGTAHGLEPLRTLPTPFGQCVVNEPWADRGRIRARGDAQQLSGDGLGLIETGPPRMATRRNCSRRSTWNSILASGLRRVAGVGRVVRILLACKVGLRYTATVTIRARRPGARAGSVAR
jgi:hypothetical protein